MLPLDKLPTIDYGVGTGKALKMKNILPALMLTKNKYIRDTYIQVADIRQGEKPEHLAKRLYGDPHLYWIFFLLNDIVDPLTQWYMDSESLDDFVEEKYKDKGGRDGIHHFYDTGKRMVKGDDGKEELKVVKEGRIVDDVDSERLLELVGTKDFPIEIMIVTNFEYESDLNDERRRVMVFSKESINILVNHVDDFFNELNRSGINDVA